MPLAPGSEFGGYRIIAHLGTGGMGEVYHAYDDHLNRPVALKILTPLLVAETEYRQRFLNEGQVLAKLDNPHIVHVYASNILNNVPWIAMEFATGGALSSLIERERLAAERALSILDGIAVALDYAHAHPERIVHRDVKPGNILLGTGDHAYLGDFGLAKIAVGSGLTATGYLIGTPAYMAPEQIRAEVLDGRCDVYALGIVAYEILVGRIPFQSKETDEDKRRREVLQQHLLSPMPEEHVPPHAIPVLKKCLAKNRDHRYAKASEFVAALRDALTETHGITIQKPVPAPSGREYPERPLHRSTYAGDDPDDAQDNRGVLKGARLVHLADIKIPLDRVSLLLWRRRWARIAAAIQKQRPHVIVITGDFLDSTLVHAVARRRLDDFINDVFPHSFPGVKPVFAPSAKERSVVQEISQQQHVSPHLFEQLPGFQPGWGELVEDALHIYNVNPSDRAWFSTTFTDLSFAQVEEKCGTAEHLHIAAAHHHVRPAPTVDQRLDDDDPDERLKELADHGYDLVLYGRRHVTRKKVHADPLPERLKGLWLLPAPATKPLLGFNLLIGRTDGFFQVRAIRYERGGWKPQVIIAQDEEEGRTRQWRAQRQTGPGCDRLDVQVEMYKPQSEEPSEKPLDPEQPDTKAEAHRLCGDLRVKMTLHRPVMRGERLPLPLTAVVAYNATTWREVKAVAIDGTARDHLPINEDGTIKVSPYERRDIEVSGVLLNAVPTTPGDWSRMHASQPELNEIFRFEPAIAARFLHARIDCPHLVHLQAARRETRTAETAFLTVRSERTHDEVTVFRPVVGVSYGVSFVGDEPVLRSSSATPDGSDVRAWHLAVAALPRIKGTQPYRDIREALDTLLQDIFVIIRQLRDGGGADIIVDLLSIGDRLRVVMNDSIQEARIHAGEAPSSLGLSFAWGHGIAGRSLRLTHEYTWSRRNLTPPESTWSVDEWYYKHPEMKRHHHVYCRPVAIDVHGKPYAIAIVSFATHEPKSGLGDLVNAIRAEHKEVRTQCDAAFQRFTTRLSDELARIPDLTEEEDHDETS